MGFRFGVERSMSQSTSYFFPFFHEGESGGTEITIAEAFPNVLNGKRTGMHHVVGIKTIIPQFVYQDFIGRKIVAEIQFPANLVGSQQEVGFAELVAMQSVFEVPYGADGKQALQVRAEGAQLL